LERSEPNTGPGDGTSGPPAEPGTWDGERRMRGRHLGGGWRVIDGCRLTPDGPPVEIVLAHPELGLAIMELEPRWTQGAEQLLQERLKATGFAARFPGHLPIIHRRLRREVLAELPMVLTEAFSWQDPLTISADLDWIEGLREALGATDADAPTRGPVPAAPAETPSAPIEGETPPGIAAEPAPSAGPPEATPPAVHAPPLAALAAAIGKPGAPPVAANAPAMPAVAQPARGRRFGLAVGGAAIAAGVALVIVLGRQPPTETPPSEARLHVAGTAGAGTPVLTPSAGATPARVAIRDEAAPPPTEPAVAHLAAGVPFAEARAPRPEVADQVSASPPATEPIVPFAEPEAPRWERAEAVLASLLPPEPIAPFAEPEAPRLERAEAVLASLLPPEPIAPFAEPEAPRLERAEAVLASLLPPEPIAPFAEPDAPRLEAAEAVLASQLPPEPIAPFAEPDAPRLEAAEAVLASQLPPEPIAPFAEPDAPRLEAAEAVLASQLPPVPIAPFAEPDTPRLEAAEAVLASQLPPVPIAPFAEPDAPRLEEVERVLAAALAPPPVAAAPAPAAPAAPPSAAVAAPPAPSMAPEMVEMLLRRGSELMRLGDVSAARRFFERAAAGGSGEAALATGATYDPRELQRIGARGIPPDRNAALTWYRRAAALGVAEAQDRIRALEATQ
jgi:hypothetical protein